MDALPENKNQKASSKRSVKTKEEAATISAAEKEERDQRLSCRYYEEEYPEKDTCVMVQVKSIAEMGAYVSLLEYKDIEGMILLSELSRRRIRSINKLIRVGKMEVAMVMRVDKEKGYIDLSKRRVASDDIAKCEERYNKGKAVHSIMRHVAQTTGSNLLELNKAIAWPLAKRPEFKTTYEAFRFAIADPDAVFKGLEIAENVKAALLANIRRRLTPQPIKIRADVEVSCFTYEGIDAVRDALIAGEQKGTEDIPVTIKLIAPPTYVLLTQSLEKKAGIATLQSAIDAAKAVVEERGGKLVVKKAPRATSQLEENALANLMEKMEMENREVGGDDDEEEE